MDHLAPPKIRAPFTDAIAPEVLDEGQNPGLLSKIVDPKTISNIWKWLVLAESPMLVDILIVLVKAAISQRVFALNLTIFLLTICRDACLSRRAN